MGEGVDGAAYCLLEKEVVDVLQAAFQPDTGEPDGGEGSRGLLPACHLQGTRR